MNREERNGSFKNYILFRFDELLKCKQKKQYCMSKSWVDSDI